MTTPVSKNNLPLIHPDPRHRSTRLRDAATARTIVPDLNYHWIMRVLFQV